MTPPSTDISPPPLKRRRISPKASSTTPPDQAPSHPTTHSPSAVSHSLSIYSWNVNGISPFLPPSTPRITTFLKSSSNPQTCPHPSLRICLRSWDWPHIVVLQEVKIAATDSKTQIAVKHVINAPLDSEDEDDNVRPLYDAYFCLPRDKHNATGFGGKVYGVCTLVRRSLKAINIRNVDWDLEGRVLICEVPDQARAVFNVYAVNGTTYDYRNPVTGQVTGNRHDRKRAFHTLLADEAKDYEKQGWSVVIAGDINISRSTIDSFPQLRMGEDHVRNRADFEKNFIEELGMLDTFRELKGEERKYSYRPRGKPWGAGVTGWI